MTGTHVLPDPATPFGETVRARLRDEHIIWLTTVAPSGTPQPNPVWYLWQPDPDDAWGDGSFLIYHDNSAQRLRTLTERPRVALNFNSVKGGGITVFTGPVEVLDNHPPAHRIPEYAAKYNPLLQVMGRDRNLAEFMARYSIVTRVRPEKVRGF
ncbi:pyridoxamine 5'-phosphate oxidase family protein [Actinospica sp.]|uniref:pyridoxamine 5'-phosphate oxidase family protein n=1 Tax=Actinospica sp. TaxID=1872142 RepID=UPI002B52AA66|nr:pyridoxamine 5'-phosphate oxidase family protein [Actinospica sp.]HWG25845.1 pyridoxamine 5'-phosphate oxidase family protein [Actinospica sp.]